MVVVSFGICAALVVRLMQREARRERRRRREEHLAFAGVLADGIVHDFRNPMSSVRLDAQMLAKEAERQPAPATERVRELAGRIRHTVDRMDKVFQEFLYMSRPPSDERERVDLEACLRDCLAVLAPRFEQAGLKVETELATPGLAVLAYPAALQRALLNVLTNAEQFSPPGGAVRIRAAAAGDTAVLEVMDAGPGIPAADRERIFEMFYSTRPGGTGLGLFLAKTAIERCGGAIEATNGPAGGACFHIRLPLAKEGA
jgi:signal transduction histidine kinase